MNPALYPLSPSQADLAHAVRPPNGLPRLRHLELTEVNQLDDLSHIAGALRDRPHALRPIEKLIVILHTFDLDGDELTGMGALGGAMRVGRGLAGLKELKVAFDDGDDRRLESTSHGALVEALAGGAGRLLEKVSFPTCPGLLDVVLLSAIR